MDLGCGSGQASCDLAALFSRVVGIDASAEQLAHADRSKPNVEYRCGPVERTGLPPQCADLVAAATALHWCAAWRRRTVMPAMHLLHLLHHGTSSTGLTRCALLSLLRMFSAFSVHAAPQV